MVQAADFAKTLQLTVLSPSTQTEWDIFFQAEDGIRDPYP